MTAGMRITAAMIAIVAAAAAGQGAAVANVALVKVSHDTYTNGSSQHHTEVEPDTHSHGSTEVAAFQVGRFFNGGASNNGFAVTTNGGSTWSHGVLPGTTVLANGPWARVSDPAVAFDPKHNVWLISSLAIDSSVNGAAVIVNRSTTGGKSWTNPVRVTPPGGNLDKDWITCDETAASPHYGNCYVEWDDNGSSNLVYMSTSTDGGATWGAPRNTTDMFHGIGGQPVVQPNGTVVVAIDNLNESAVEAFLSTDGGGTWTAPVAISSAQDHAAGGSFRNGSLPSAVVDTGGTVDVAWESCSQEPGCSNNDILFSKSTNGTTWTAPAIVPIDPTGSGIDHMLPGLGVDPATAGASAHLGIVYYTEPAACTSACAVSVGFIASSNGGSTWTAPQSLAGPIKQSWIANTSQGRMVGDYNSTSFLNGKAYPVFASARTVSGSTFKENMFTPKGGLTVGAGVAGLIVGGGTATAAVGRPAATAR
jgi:hypothetical protein